MNNTSKVREGIIKGCEFQSFEKKGEQGWITTQHSKHWPRRKEGLSQPTWTRNETHPCPWDHHTSPYEQRTKKARLYYREELRTWT